MANTLREKLIGAWQLVSYEERPVDGSEPFFPMGQTPMGLIMYTPDGFMSAQLSQQDRKPFASGDWFKATDDEFRNEATTYIAYSGPFNVDEENQHLTHSMFISLFPNWIGQTQPRVVQVEGDHLFLSTASPISSGGKIVNSHLEWRRANVSTMAPKWLTCLWAGKPAGVLAASIGATGTALAQQHLRNVLAYHAFEEVPELAVVHYVGGINIYISSVHIVNERNRQEAVIHLSRILPAIRSGDV